MRILVRNADGELSECDAPVIKLPPSSRSSSSRSSGRTRSRSRSVKDRRKRSRSRRGGRRPSGCPSTASSTSQEADNSIDESSVGESCSSSEDMSYSSHRPQQTMGDSDAENDEAMRYGASRDRNDSTMFGEHENHTNSSRSRHQTLRPRGRAESGSPVRRLDSPLGKSPVQDISINNSPIRDISNSPRQRNRKLNRDNFFNSRDRRAHSFGADDHSKAPSLFEDSEHESEPKMAAPFNSLPFQDTNNDTQQEDGPDQYEEIEVEEPSSEYEEVEVDSDQFEEVSVEEEEYEEVEVEVESSSSEDESNKEDDGINLQGTSSLFHDHDGSDDESVDTMEGFEIHAPNHREFDDSVETLTSQDYTNFSNSGKSLSHSFHMSGKSLSVPQEVEEVDEEEDSEGEDDSDAREHTQARSLSTMSTTATSLSAPEEAQEDCKNVEDERDFKDSPPQPVHAKPISILRRPSYGSRSAGSNSNTGSNVASFHSEEREERKTAQEKNDKLPVESEESKTASPTVQSRPTTTPVGILRRTSTGSRASSHGSDPNRRPSFAGVDKVDKNEKNETPPESAAAKKPAGILRQSSFGSRTAIKNAKEQQNQVKDSTALAAQPTLKKPVGILRRSSFGSHIANNPNSSHQKEGGSTNSVPASAHSEEAQRRSSFASCPATHPADSNQSERCRSRTNSLPASTHPEEQSPCGASNPAPSGQDDKLLDEAPSVAETITLENDRMDSEETITLENDRLDSEEAIVSESEPLDSEETITLENDRLDSEETITLETDGGGSEDEESITLIPSDDEAAEVAETPVSPVVKDVSEPQSSKTDEGEDAADDASITLTDSKNDNGSISLENETRNESPASSPTQTSPQPNSFTSHDSSKENNFCKAPPSRRMKEVGENSSSRLWGKALETVSIPEGTEPVHNNANVDSTTDEVAHKSLSSSRSSLNYTMEPQVNKLTRRPSLKQKETKTRRDRDSSADASRDADDFLDEKKSKRRSSKRGDSPVKSSRSSSRSKRGERSVAKTPERSRSKGRSRSRSKPGEEESKRSSRSTRSSIVPEEKRHSKKRSKSNSRSVKSSADRSSSGVKSSRSSSRSKKREKSVDKTRERSKSRSKKDRHSSPRKSRHSSPRRERHSSPRRTRHSSSNRSRKEKELPLSTRQHTQDSNKKTKPSRSSSRTKSRSSRSRSQPVVDPCDVDDNMSMGSATSNSSAPEKPIKKKACLAPFRADQVYEEQRKDASLRKLMSKAKASRKYDISVMSDGGKKLVLFSGRYYLPESLRSQALRYFHKKYPRSSLHFLERNFYWPYMEDDVQSLKSDQGYHGSWRFVPREPSKSSLTSSKTSLTANDSIDWTV